MRALNTTQAARELGRSTEWLNINWPDLVKRGKIPRPILEKGGLTWSAAQFYAFLDRELPAGMRKQAAAFRAAYAAAFEAPGVDLTDDIAAARQQLNSRFNRQASSSST